MKIQLIVLFLVVGVTPLAIAAVLSYRGAYSALTEADEKAAESLEHQTFSQLVALRDVKKSQIGQYFEEREGDMGVLTETVASLKEEAFAKIRVGQQHKIKQLNDFFQKVNSDVTTLATSRDVMEVYEQLVQYHIDTDVEATGNYDVTTDDYRKIWEENNKFLGQYVENCGYYDVFIICAKHGHVMYSACKENDLGENLGHGKLKDSGLSRMWQKVIETDGVAYDDFSPYAPSDGQQAAFVGAPLHDDDGEIVAVIALQLPTDPINAIAQQREGMGATGESYLVGKTDGQTAYRSDRVVKTGNKIGMPKSGSSIDKALAGESGCRIKVGSTGAVEVEAYAPLDVPGLDWCIITSASLEEILASKQDGQEQDFFAKYIEKYG